MKKKFFTSLIILFIVGTLFAQSKQQIPQWMGKSVILLTDYLYGEQKTINDLFGKPKETTTVVVKSTDNELLLSHEVGADGVVILKIDIYFKLSKVGDAGTCYISKLYYESPMTFESQTLTCFGPYNDPENYGQILDTISSLQPMLYD